MARSITTPHIFNARMEPKIVHNTTNLQRIQGITRLVFPMIRSASISQQSNRQFCVNTDTFVHSKNRMPKYTDHRD